MIIMVKAEMEQIIMDGMVFRAVSAAAMVISTTLVATVTGGVLRSTIQTMLGTALWAKAMTKWTEPSTLRTTVFLSVVSRINFCAKRAQSQVRLSYAERSKNDEIIYLFIGC